MNLEAARLNMGLTARDAAKRIGIADHVLRYAEQGGRPRPKAAKLIADFYGCKVTDLWPVEEPQRSAAA